MEQSLKLYTIAGVLLLLCSCRLSGPLSSRYIGPYNYETYAPVKEVLSFINDSLCIYTQYDTYNKNSISAVDTCYWKYGERDLIILYHIRDNLSNSYIDSAQMANLNFVWDICPKWSNIKRWEFMNYKDSKYPLYQEKLFTPRRTPSFSEKFGKRQVICDTIINDGYCMWWIRRPIPTFAFSANKHIIPKEFKGVGTKRKLNLYRWACSTYEYINYKVNYEKKVDFELDSIKGKQFSYIGEACKKESIRFVNDSVCTHYLSTRESVSSPYVPQGVDSCRYSVKNNLIAIDFEKDKSCDTLTYSNGIIFYSKVYKEGEKYTHVVKPFIDETRSCANKADSIDMIMSTYFNVYVPLNMYK